MSETMPFFYGCAENKLNSKGQVAIPARFRGTLPDTAAFRQFVLLRGEPQCLYMYTHEQFGKIKDNARRVAEESGDRDFFRGFMAKVYAVEVDAQGRFVLPQVLMKEVGIQGPAVLFLGVDDRIEVWEPGVYTASATEGTRFEKMRSDAARSIFGI